MSFNFKSLSIDTKIFDQELYGSIRFVDSDDNYCSLKINEDDSIEIMAAIQDKLNEIALRQSQKLIENINSSYVAHNSSEAQEPMFKNMEKLLTNKGKK